MKLLKGGNGLGVNTRRGGGKEEDRIERGVVVTLGFWDPFHPRGGGCSCQGVCWVTHSRHSSSQPCGTSDGLRGPDEPCTLAQGDSLKLEESVIKSWKSGQALKDFPRKMLSFF